MGLDNLSRGIERKRIVAASVGLPHFNQVPNADKSVEHDDHGDADAARPMIGVVIV